MVRSSTSKSQFPKPQGNNRKNVNQIPKNWPSDVIYIEKPVYHPSVPKSVVQQLKEPESKSKLQSSPFITNHNPGQPLAQALQAVPVPVPIPMVRPLSDGCRIQMITSPSHPANGQRGLFATKKIEPNTLIVYYLGEVHAEDRVRSDYDLSLLRTNANTNTNTNAHASAKGEKDETAYISIGIDASKMGNEGRFVNDYRGIAPRANAVFKEVRMGMEADGQLTMGIRSGPQSQGIRKGDEIVVSYGKAWWASRRQNS